MQTTAVSGATGVPSTAQRGLGNMKSEDFFRVLVTELQQQDPFEPAKTADMINQVAQIREIELSGQLNKTLDQLAGQQRTLGASDLIGKYVIAAQTSDDGSASRIEGVVTGVRFESDGTAILELDTGESVPVSAVAQVTTLEQILAAQSALLANSSATSDAGKDAADAAAKSAARSRPSLLGWDWLKLDAAVHV